SPPTASNAPCTGIQTLKTSFDPKIWHFVDHYWTRSQSLEPLPSRPRVLRGHHSHGMFYIVRFWELPPKGYLEGGRFIGRQPEIIVLPLSDVDPLACGIKKFDMEL